MTVDPRQGPAEWWSDTLPAAPSQHRAIAHLAAELLGLGELQSRYDASVAITRMRHAVEHDAPRDPLPDVEGF